MNPVAKFWETHFPHPAGRPLESDSRISRIVNRRIVAGIMNTFPKTTTKLLSFSRGEFARLMIAEKDGGSFKSLRVMYEYEDPTKRGDLINRLLMHSPGVKAARNRRKIAQRILRKSLEKQPVDKPVLVLVPGGGDGRLESEVLADVPRNDVYLCIVDKDSRAIEENKKNLEQFGLEKRGAVFLGDISEKNDLLAVIESARRKFGVQFDGANIAVCNGIAEYLDMGSKSNDILLRVLKAIHNCVRDGGDLIISQTDYHDRVRWVERGLGWHMRMRNLEELAAEVENAGWHIRICEHEPMQLITMCQAVKSDQPQRRIDSPSQLRHPMTKQHVEAEAESLVIA